MYFLFSRQARDKNWHFDGEFETKKRCEDEMEQTGEPEGIEYKVIKGIELEYEDGVPIFPYTILEED